MVQPSLLVHRFEIILALLLRRDFQAYAFSRDHISMGFKVRRLGCSGNYISLNSQEQLIIDRVHIGDFETIIYWKILR